jgi:RNA polymerase sigma-70 factor (ECF subfamily)
MRTVGEMAVPGRRKRAADNGAGDEEQRLVRAAWEGDHSAFDALVQRHWRKIASVVGQFLDDPNDVEDATQETFVRAYENLRGFRGEASLRTWLIRIAVNVCRNKRGEFWRRRVSLEGDDATLHGEPADAKRLAEAAMCRDDLRRAVHRLPEKLRLPIVLHFFEELSGAETAAILGWKESTVWSRIYAGCRELRNQLATDAE